MTGRVLARLAVLASVLTAAPAAEAAPFNRLILRGEASVQATASVRSTETVVLDLSTLVAPATSSEPILVTNNTPATLSVWPYPDLAPGQSYAYRQRYLDGLVTLKTSGASGSAGLLTLQGAYGRRAARVSLTSAEYLSFRWGTHTGYRRGGFPLYLLDAIGPRGGWTITGVTDNAGVDRTAQTLFERYNDRIVVRCNGTTTVGGQCPPDGQDTVVDRAGASLPSQWPAAPTGTWALQLTNTLNGAVRTIALVMTPHQYDISPTPSWVTDNATNSQICGVIGSNGVHFGDVLMLEGYAANKQTYGGGSVTNWRCASGLITRSSYAGGPGAPTEAAGYGDGVNDAGWITVTARETLGAYVRYIELNHRWFNDDAIWHPAYIRWLGLDLTQGGPRSIVAGAASGKVSMVQWDFNDATQIFQGTVGDSTKDMFVTNNRVVNSGGDGINVAGCDVQIMDNWVFAPTTDSIHHGVYQCTPGGSRAKVARNFAAQPVTRTTPEHKDNSQQDFGLASSGISKALGAVNYLADYLNNIFVEIPHLVDCADVYVTGTKGTYSGAGCSGSLIANAWAGPSDIGLNYLAGGQGLLASDTGSVGQYVNRVRFVGNIITSPYLAGINTGALGPGSVLRYNVVLGNTIPLGSGGYKNSGLASGAINIYGAGAKIIAEGNISTALNLGEFFGTTAVAPSTGVGNLFGIGAGAYATYFNDPANLAGRDLKTPDAWLDMMAPKAAAVVGGQPMGAIGTGVDWWARTVDPALLTSTVGLNPPLCTAVATVGANSGVGSGTGKVANDQLVANDTSAFNPAATSTVTRWVRINQNPNTDQIVASNSNTYTVTATDLNYGSTVTLYFVKEGINADGTAACVANGFQIKP